MTKNDSGEDEFFQPDNSNISPTILDKFRYRNVHFVISPLPLEDALKSARIKHGLLCLARQLNDNAKAVKTATLNDQLIKARKVLTQFLRSATLPNSKEKVFGKKQQIWPQCHADLENPVYSQSGIQTEVKKALSAEFISCVSAIKLLATSPEDVFELLLKITSIYLPPNKDGDSKPLVNSTKSLGFFTLNYYPKAKLIEKLNTILNLAKQKPLKNFNLTKFAKDHQQEVKFNTMLNAISTDILKHDDSRLFAEKLGHPVPEGFYGEHQFEKVYRFYL